MASWRVVFNLAQVSRAQQATVFIHLTARAKWLNGDFEIAPYIDLSVVHSF